MLKEVQNGTKSGSPIVKIFGETLAKRVIFVMSLGSGQLANYEISYSSAITCIQFICITCNQLKLCRQKVL